MFEKSFYLREFAFLKFGEIRNSNFAQLDVLVLRLVGQKKFNTQYCWLLLVLSRIGLCHCLAFDFEGSDLLGTLFTKLKVE